MLHRLSFVLVKEVKHTNGIVVLQGKEAIDLIVYLLGGIPQPELTRYLPQVFTWVKEIGDGLIKFSTTVIEDCSVILVHALSTPNPSLPG